MATTDLVRLIRCCVGGRWRPLVPKFAAALAPLALAVLLGGCQLLEMNIVGLRDSGSRAPDAATQALVINKPISGDVLIAGGINAAFDSSANSEFFHAATGKFLTTGALANSAAGVNAVILPKMGNLVMEAGGATVAANLVATRLTVSATALNTATIYHKATGTFAATGKLKTPRTLGTATVLKDGTVLFAGGFDPLGTPIASAEIYDPPSGSFKPTKGAMHDRRALHSATLLPDGTVLIFGGMNTTTGGTVATAELYSPVTGLFTPTKGNPTASLAGHTATLIAGCGCVLDGKVMIADGVIGITSGGIPYVETNAVAMLYNPATQLFDPLPYPNEPRVLHTATLLPGGKVLLAGGFAGALNIQGGVLNGYSTNLIRASAEIFDPKANTFTCVGGPSKAFACPASMKFSRAAHSATLLSTGPEAGRVLLAGGIGAPRGSSAVARPTNSTEMFNPKAPGFASTAPMNAGHAFQAAVLLP